MKIVNNLPKLREDDTSNSIVTYDSVDSTDVTEWTDVDLLESGEKHRSLFKKISSMFKNIRYLFKKTEDINTYLDTDMNMYSNLITEYKASNLAPSWYMSNHAQRVVQEFKYASVVGIASSDYLGVMETIVPWSDSSGGLPTQTYYLNVNGSSTAKGIYRRYATSTTEWSDWQAIHRNGYDIAYTTLDTIYSGTYYSTKLVDYIVRGGICYVYLGVVTNTSSNSWVKIASGLPTPINIFEFNISPRGTTSGVPIQLRKDALGNLYVAFGTAGLSYYDTISYPVQ